MDPLIELNNHITRRRFFGDNGLRVGGIALASLLGQNTARASGERIHPPLPGLPHFPPKAKSLIYLHMNGAPSQLDTWDYKPGLRDMFDKDLPPSVIGNQRLTTMSSGQGRFPIAPSKFNFIQAGKSGRWINGDLMPHQAKIVDEIALIKTVHTKSINHDPGSTFLFTGNELPGRASLGSWLSYGLGSENDDLPAFVVFTPRFPQDSNGQAIFSRLWNSGYLPAKFSGVALRGSGDPVLYLKDPNGVSRNSRRAMLDSLNQLNAKNYTRFQDPQIEARIAQYEMAFRIQTSVPELTDIKGEPQSVLDLYGPDVQVTGSFAHSALLARRLVERGVRVVQLLHRGWDQHGNLPYEIGNQLKDTDQGVAALILDLKQRGMLDDTLVVWGGEFGRTVYSQGQLTKEVYGRDHHPRNFCMWMAGAGVKPGISYGETDEFSYNIIDKDQFGVHVNDINATILERMGIDHNKLTYEFQGLDQKITGVEPARVVSQILT